MITPAIPENESQRLKALKTYNLLDTLPEDAYNTITELAAYICNTPISLVTLLDADRNFLKAHKGVDLAESPRSTSFCGHAILSPEPVFVVEDAREDERFADNPLVRDFKAIFYAGVPLKTSEGYALGTLCVYDNVPRKLTSEQLEALRRLATQVILLFEARKHTIELEKSQVEIAKRNERLEAFANLIAHDLKSPLASIEGLLHLLSDEFPDKDNSDLMMYFKLLNKSTKGLRSYIDGLLNYYKTDSLLANKDDTSLLEIVNELKGIYPVDGVSISLDTNLLLHGTSKAALQQIIGNLIDNGIKYNKSEMPSIVISGHQIENYYAITVTDNGIGVPEDQKERIFDLFKVTSNKDRNGNYGTGMGLATVKKLILGLGGTITVTDAAGEGSIFTFTIRRD